VGLPDDIIRVALLAEMSPLKELPVHLHLLSAGQAGKLRVADPLKSFLRVVEHRLGWKVCWHDDYDKLAATVRESEYPPYFFCTKDKHVLPLNLLTAVAENCGYVYEGLPTDALSLFRWLTATQAWTVACTEGQVQEAQAELQKLWKEAGLRAESHEAPEVVKPVGRPDVGGGFGASPFDGLGGDDKDWGELSDDDGGSSDDEPEVKKAGEDKPKATDASGDKATAAKVAGGD